MVKHFVHFLSPGTFVSEVSVREIKSWDPDLAVEMSYTIEERYQATPYAFYFTTRARDDEDFDSKETSRSGLYHLGGEILTTEDVEAENDPKLEILLSNMRCNSDTMSRMVRSTNSWLHYAPFRDGDVLLDYEPRRTPQEGQSEATIAEGTEA